MSDISATKADPPAQEGADTSKLHTDNITKNDQTRLSDLHQVYIDGISKYLNLRDVGRLQLTCKDLYQKGFQAQRRFTLPLDVDLCSGGGINVKLIRRNRRCRRWTQKRLGATNWRVRFDVNVMGPLTLVHIRKVTELLGGRGTINKMDFRFDGRISPDLETNFNRFLQNFNVSELCIREMPREFLQLAGMKQLTSLAIGLFPLSPIYLLDTAIHTCRFSLDERPGRPDSAEMHEILEKWTRNEKVIKDYTLSNFNWDVNALFFGWDMVDEGEEIPDERPIVIRDNSRFYRGEYRVVR